MSTQYRIQDLENDLKQAEGAYLRRFGWTETCETPGALWLWRRDFANADARRLEWWEAHPNTTKPTPYGVLTTSMEVALIITKSYLDQESEQ